MKSEESSKVSLSQSYILRGIAITMVMLYHYMQFFRDYLPDSLYVFRGLGALACSVFFFLSGYGLTISNKPFVRSGKQYWIKRFLALYVPFLLCNIIYFMYYRCVDNTISQEVTLVDVFWGTASINPAGWFLQCLLLQYIGLAIGKNIKHIILFNIGGGSIYTMLTSSVMTFSWLCFPLGVLFAKTSFRIKFKFAKYAKITSILFAVSYMFFLIFEKVNTALLLINFIIMLFYLR